MQFVQTDYLCFTIMFVSHKTAFSFQPGTDFLQDKEMQSCVQNSHAARKRFFLLQTWAQNSQESAECFAACE